MNKAFRQGQILKLIRAKRILTQDDLARELKQSHGIETTQVTLSRDVRELGLLKTPEGLSASGSGRGRSRSGHRGWANSCKTFASAQNLIGAENFARQRQRARRRSG